MIKNSKDKMIRESRDKRFKKKTKGSKSAKVDQSEFKNKKPWQKE